MSKLLNFIKKLFWIGFFSGIFVILSVILINLHINLFSKDYIFSEIKKLPSDTEVIMILGAKVYPNGNLSHMLYDRALMAIEVYESGKVGKLLVSGDNGENRYDEVRPTKNFIIKQGVPAENLFLDFAGFDTYDSMYRAKEIFEIEKILISTQEFHQARAIFIARKLGIEAYGITSDKRTYATISWNKRREILANVKAWFDVLLESEPKYLGDVISIEGVGNSVGY